MDKRLFRMNSKEIGELSKRQRITERDIVEGYTSGNHISTPLTLARIEKLELNFADLERVAYQMGYIVKIEVRNIKTVPMGVVEFYERMDRMFDNGVEISYCHVPVKHFRNGNGQHTCHHYRQCQAWCRGRCWIGDETDKRRKAYAEKVRSLSRKSQQGITGPGNVVGISNVFQEINT